MERCWVVFLFFVACLRWLWESVRVCGFLFRCLVVASLLSFFRKARSATFLRVCLFLLRQFRSWGNGGSGGNGWGLEGMALRLNGHYGWVSEGKASVRGRG